MERAIPSQKSAIPFFTYEQQNPLEESSSGKYSVISTPPHIDYPFTSTERTRLFVSFFPDQERPYLEIIFSEKNQLRFRKHVDYPFTSKERNFIYLHLQQQQRDKKALEKLEKALVDLNQESLKLEEMRAEQDQRLYEFHQQFDTSQKPESSAFKQATEENPSPIDKELAEEFAKTRQELADSKKLSDEVRETIEESKALLARSQQVVEQKERELEQLKRERDSLETSLVQYVLWGVSYALSFFTTQND
ncbi:MAG: hypothetical protein KDK96_07545 [Chlamydiia bacterium]|nr:hypothetical protein [Chlamydiia bacterium]